MHKVYTNTLSLQGRVHHGRKRREALGSRSSPSTSFELLRVGAKGELLGPGHHQGRPLATQGAEEKDKWVWQRRPPMWEEVLQ